MTSVVPTPWPVDDDPPELAPGAVRVFSASLSGPAELELLTAAERERAEGFATAELTRRWSRARAALRRVLAAYAEVEPAEVAIEPAACVHCGEPHGKPYLAAPALGWLRFNLSHSGDLVVVAVAHGREVGVDVESTRAGRSVEGIAGRWFNAREATALKEADAPRREALFYRLWARKEAYLKATAEGIAGSLASFDALALEGAGADPTGPLSDGDGWEFADLDVGDGHAGALALAPPEFRPARAPAGVARPDR